MPQTGVVADGSLSQGKGNIRFIDRVMTSLPSAMIFIGLMFLAMADARGNYLIGAGVVAQVLFLVLRVPGLFR